MKEAPSLTIRVYDIFKAESTSRELDQIRVLLEAKYRLHRAATGHGSLHRASVEIMAPSVLLFGLPMTA
jgi:hypothetical protein